MLPRCCTASCCARRVPHARIVAHRHVARAARCPACSWCSPARDFPITYGILPVSQDEHALCRRSRALRRRSGRRRRSRVDEETAFEALDLIDVEYEPLAHHRRPRRQPRHRRAAHPRLRRRRQRPQGGVAASSATSTQALADADRVFEDIVLLPGQHAPADRAARRASRRSIPTASCVALVEHADAALRAPRAGQGARRCRRRTSASSPRPNGGGFGGKSDPFNHEIVVAKAALMLDRPGQDLPDPRRGLLLPPRPPSGADVVQDRREERTARSPACTCRRCSTAAPTAATAWRQHLLHRRAADGHLSHPALPLRAAAASSPTSRRAGPSAATARRSRASARRCSSTRSPKRSAIDPAELRLAHRRAARHADRQLAARRHRSASPSASTRVVAASGWNEQLRQAAARARRSASPARRTCAAPGLPIYWNDMPHSGVQLKLDRSGGVTAFCGATEIGQGSDDVLVACVAEVLGIEPIDIRAVTGDTDLTPVDLGSLLSRVTLMTGNAAIQAAERARDAARRRGRRRSSTLPTDAARVRRAARLRRREPGRAASRSPRRCSWPRRSSARSAPTGSLHAAASRRGDFKGARRRAVAGLLATRPRWSKSRSIRRPAGSHVPQSLDRARHRPRAQPGAGARPGRGQRLHGARRGADGGAGVPPAAAEAVARARAQVSVDARVQEPDARSTCRRSMTDLDRGARSERARSAPRRSARGRCCRSCRRSPTRSTTRSACASTRCRSRRRRS